MKKIFACILAALACAAVLPAKDYSVTSPSGAITATVSVDKTTSLSVKIGGKKIMENCRIAMTLSDGIVLGDNSVIRKDSRGNRTEKITAPFYRQSAFQTSYNYLSLRYEGNYTLQIRVYNDGVAYRFVTSFPDNITVTNETVQYNFVGEAQAIIPWRKNDPQTIDPYESSFENQYSVQNIGEYGENEGRLAFLPVVVRSQNWGNILLTESDVEDYPGMFVKLSDHGFEAVFPPVPEGKTVNFRGVERPERYTDHIATTTGSRSFPWRIIAYAAQDKDLPTNNMVYQTASASRIDEMDWITPGLSTWDWWNASVLYNVPFKAGINTDTYKYHIDFAAANGIKYVIIDDGWYKDFDLMSVNEDLNLKYLCGYAQESGVKLILWSACTPLYNDAEQLCSYYSKLGVAGFKVDFFDAQDQNTVKKIYELAEITAKHKLILDLHGMYKPTGLNRTYPNILNFEGVHGLEQMKWSPKEETDMPANDTYIPYLRMVAGPVDYTQGAMRNARKEEFIPVFGRPMSQGTRAHQIALYVIFDSPLNMLCDSPSAYMDDMPTTGFITAIPTVFNSTRVLDGKMGESIITLREKDGKYYMGGITNWDERTSEVSLDFLPEGKWKAIIYKDGANADVTATDHVIETLDVDSSTVLNLYMAPGGGFAVIIEK